MCDGICSEDCDCLREEMSNDKFRYPTKVVILCCRVTREEMAELVLKLPQSPR